MVRKMIAVLAMLCLAALVGWAGEGHGKMDAASHAAKLKAELNLSADQTAKVENIFADLLKKMEPIHTKSRAVHEQLKALRSASPADAAALRAKESELESAHAQKQALLAERDAAMKKVLTPEQSTKFQELAAAHSKQLKEADHPK